MTFINAASTFTVSWTRSVAQAAHMRVGITVMTLRSMSVRSCWNTSYVRRRVGRIAV